MCLSPLIIDNPHCLDYQKNGFNFSSEHFSRLAQMHDVHSARIAVPCGTCEECTSLRQSYWLQRAIVQSLDCYLFFGTLTYNNDSLMSISKVGLNGKEYTYKYALMDDFRYMIKRMRTWNMVPEGTKYICCSEYGTTRHRPHLHFLLFIPKKSFYYGKFRPNYDYGRFYFDNDNSDFFLRNYEKFLYSAILSEWKRKISSSRKNPQYLQLCTFARNSRGECNYDFHLVTEFLPSGDSVKTYSDVCAYVTKYILKYDPWVKSLRQAIYNNYSPEDYAEIWNIIRPRMLVSKGFGFTERAEEIVNESLQFGLSTPEASKGRLIFLNPLDGRVIPMSPYYVKKYVTWLDYSDYISLRKRIDHLPLDSDYRDILNVEFLRDPTADYYSKKLKYYNSRRILIANLYNDCLLL